MTVREFNGISDELVTDVGAASGMVYGTVAVLLKFSTITSFRDWIMLHTAGGSFVWTPVGLTNFSTLQMFSNGASSNSGINPGTTSWKLLVVRKDTGTTTPRFSVYDYSSATWTHAAGGSTLSDSSSPPGVGGQARFTYQDSSDFFGGRVAARALWSNSLPWTADAAGDAAIAASGLKDAASNWMSANPSAFWLFNQASTATPVDDLSAAGTADQTSITGTTVITGDDPPGFDFSIGGSSFTGDVALSGAGALGGSGTPAVSGTRALNGSGSLAPSAVPAPAANLALAGSGSLASTATVATASAVALAGTGSLTETGKPGHTGTTSLVGAGSLAIAGPRGTPGHLTATHTGPALVAAHSAPTVTATNEPSSRLEASHDV